MKRLVVVFARRLGHRICPAGEPVLSPRRCPGFLEPDHFGQARILSKGLSAGIIGNALENDSCSIIEVHQMEDADAYRESWAHGIPMACFGAIN